MKESKKLNAVRQFFAADHFAAEAGITIESAEAGGAVCSVQAGARHCNAAGSVQGGLLFTLADFTFAVAANAAVIAAEGGMQAPGTVTLGSDIHFLRPARPGRLVATAQPQNAGRRTSVYAVQVTDETGMLVATATVTGFARGIVPGHRE